MMELKKIKSWQCREGKRFLQAFRIYCGNKNLGTAYFSVNKNGTDLYYFDTLPNIPIDIEGKKSLPEIEDECALQLKEFIASIRKPLQLIEKQEFKTR